MAALLIIPLASGQHVSVGTINKFINQAVVREKTLKIVQYAARLVSYYAKQQKVKKELAEHLLNLSKDLSKARRFFKFLRWFRHFLDLRDAHKMEAPTKYLFYVEFCFNMLADCSEDITSLGKLKILPANWFPGGVDNVEYYANWCQLPLAFIEVAICSVKLQNVKKDDYIKYSMAKLELLKYLFDIGKGVFDCKISWAREDVFLWSGLFAALITTHKQMIKSLKLPESIQKNPSAFH